MQHDQTDQNPAPNLPTDRRAMLAGIGGLAAGAFLAGKANAGPLTPPPGPIQSTPGPEPRIPINAQNTPGNATALFRITQAGSYYLTENISVPSGLIGIEIAMSDVTIDLNGFRIEGFLGLSSHGIFVPSGIVRRNITIRNGSIVTCGGSGIDLTGSSHNAVESVNVRGNTGDGIRTGDSSRVADCSAESSGTNGILTGQNAIVQNCIAQASGGAGIDAGPSSSILNCTARDNSSHGIKTATGCTLSGCTAASNAGTGIVAGVGSSIANCTARTNSADGIATSANCVLSNSSASSNTGIGINTTGSGATLTNCSANGNTIAGFSINTGSTLTNCTAYINQGDGIVTSQNNTITNCLSRSNQGHGISTATGCTILDCSVTFNTLDGIRFSSECLVRGNNASYAGWIAGDGAAIHATGQLNRIEANHASRSDRGIDVDGQGNVIVRNTCTNNSGGNFVMVANNVYGPILNRITPASPAVNGNTATSTLGSTDANANYAH